jgi:thiol:disulfide interchange protein DsbD
MRKIVVLLITAVLFSFLTKAQIFDPVKWKYELKQVDKHVYDLVFKAKIDSSWHLYSQNIPPDGPVPTSFRFDSLVGIEMIGKVEEKSKVIEEYDSNFEMVLKYFGEEAIFIQRVKVTGDVDSIKGSLEFMTCDNKQCLPPKEEEFAFVLKAPEMADTSGKSLFGFLLTAFIAGLLALITPCVFPMVPMTVSFFMHGEKKRSHSIRNAIIFGGSITAIYTIVGSVVAVIFGPDFAHWISTHWLPNVLFFIIFVIFAASFLGMFEITLPSWMITKSDTKADKGGASGAFFMALTTVLVSFSCTGPIVGYLIVESISGQILKPVLGMFTFGFAFALPFTLFALFPSWLKNMPKSGGWLNAVKVVLGFLELALGLKFLSVADQTYHWGILDREVYIAFWIVIFFLLGLYLLGKLKFAHDSDVPYLGVPRLMLAIITFTFVIYLVPGMFGAPLKALSGYLPPQHTHDFDINAIIRNNAKEIMLSSPPTATTDSVENNRKALCETPKFSDFLHLPHGLEGYFDYDQALACARAQKKPLFIDFTGHGCVNCREMEANVWSDPKVLSMLRNDYVMVALYVDDKKALPEKEWVTSTYDGKVKKNIGTKFADLQVTRFNVNAQPFYVLLDNEGEVLVKPIAYDLNVQHFVDFLENGIKEFKNRTK